MRKIVYELATYSFGQAVAVSGLASPCSNMNVVGFLNFWNLWSICWCFSIVVVGGGGGCGGCSGGGAVFVIVCLSDLGLPILCTSLNPLIFGFLFCNNLNRPSFWWASWVICEVNKGNGALDGCKWMTEQKQSCGDHTGQDGRIDSFWETRNEWREGKKELKNLYFPGLFQRKTKWSNPPKV